MSNDCVYKFMRSARRIASTAIDPSITLERGLSRLASIVVGDFPKAMFKLQVVAQETLVSVVPEFVTPRLQSLVDTYSEKLGPLDVRRARIPFHSGTIIEESLFSFDEIRLTDRERIKKYYAAHFDHADAEALGRVIMEDVGVKEVLLLPVRPEDRPFGVVSISSTKIVSPEEMEYWRLLARSIEELYRRESSRRRTGLLRLFFHNSPEPSLLIDSRGRVDDVNYALVQRLNYPDRASALSGIGGFTELLSECLSAGSEGPSVSRLGIGRARLFLTDARGDEVPFAVICHELYEPGGAITGAVLRLQAPEERKGEPLPFSRRQREIGRLIAGGRTTKEIAADLGISIHTVNYHRTQLRKRLGVSDRGEELSDRLRTFFVG